MASEFVIEAFARNDKGKGASRRLRRNERKIPAILYGGDKEPQPLAIWHNDLKKAIENEAFFSHVLTIDIEGKKESAIIKDLQRHPHKPILTHADFQRVDKHHEIHVQVPLHFINEETADAIKLEGGVISHQQTEVEVVCLPQDLPEYIEIDVAKMKMDQVLHLSDLVLPKGVRLAALAQGEDYDLAVASIHMPKGATASEEEEQESGEEGEEESGED